MPEALYILIIPSTNTNSFFTEEVFIHAIHTQMETSVGSTIWYVLQAERGADVTKAARRAGGRGGQGWVAASQLLMPTLRRRLHWLSHRHTECKTHFQPERLSWRSGKRKMLNKSPQRGSAVSTTMCSSTCCNLLGDARKKLLYVSKVRGVQLKNWVQDISPVFP